MPHIQLAEAYKLEIFKTINSHLPLNIAFRSRDTLPQSSAVRWNVKLAGENETARFLVLAFRNNLNKFVHCDLTDVKVYLNSDVYLYDGLNLKFNWNRFSVLHDMYIKFQHPYYLRDSQQQLLIREIFKTTAPIIVKKDQ